MQADRPAAMPAADSASVLGVPAALWDFLRESCRLPAHALHRLPPDELPANAARLLVHDRDMTSTLSQFHGSPLRVQILQQVRQDEIYLREVFLRTQDRDQVVEYGVIAVVWEHFTASQREAILGGHGPLGGLLHQFQIRFTSSPTCFFAVDAALLTRLPFRTAAGVRCHGRFNQLAKPSGEAIAWAMEILPPAPAPRLPSHPPPHAHPH
jgi:chorismate-pyruvate lyase